MVDIAKDFRQLLPRVAAPVVPDSRPLGFLWVWDPQHDQIHLVKEKGDHPAEFPTHKTMAQHVTHPDRAQGYVWAIVGGWRVSDADHSKIEDAHILKLIHKALRKEHPAPPLPSIRYHGDPANYSV